MKISNQVRRQRDALGLSQQALAATAGVSRQTLLAIESGKSTPSVGVALALARALNCSVEALFTGAHPPQLRVSCALAKVGDRVGLSQVDGRDIAYPFDGAADHECADGVVVAKRGRNLTVELLHPAPIIRQTLVLAGCAPAMKILANRMQRQREDVLFRTLGSLSALDELHHGRLHVAGVHPGQPGTSAFALDQHAEHSAQQWAVVALAHWELGLVTASGNPHGVRGLDDLRHPKLRVVEREAGSAVARLLAQYTVEASNKRRLLPRPQARSHRDVGLAVALGAADVGITCREVARAFQLPFIALSHERFDLVCKRSLLDDPRLGRLYDQLASLSFRRELEALGYDTHASGTHFSPVKSRHTTSA